MNRYYHIDFHNADGKLTHKKLYTATGKFIRMEEYDPQTGRFMRIVEQPLERVALYRMSSVRLTF